MKRVWVLAGTSEGREVCTLLRARGIPFLATVATAYGASLLETDSVRIGKLDEQAMIAFIEREELAAAIDATHPYAALASANAQAACAAQNIPYLRIERAGTVESAELVRVASIADTAAYLNDHDGNALITTGGNGVGEYSAVHDFQKRLFVRVLPDSKVIAKCESLGFAAGNIIAMQGPFSEELNVAMLKAVNARYLVTKDSGAAGGTAEKIAAAQKAGVSVILVTRPDGKKDAKSVSIEEAADWAQEVLSRNATEGVPCIPMQKVSAESESAKSTQQGPKQTENALFPLFIDLAGKPVLVVGGGAVGARRAGVLASFGAAVRIVAPDICEAAQKLVDAGAVEWCNRGYEAGDCAGMAIVVAATNDRAVNAAIACEAKVLGIPVSVADAPDEATFHFPAIVRKGTAVLGLTTGEPARTKEIAAKLRELMKSALNDL